CRSSSRSSFSLWSSASLRAGWVCSADRTAGPVRSLQRRRRNPGSGARAGRQSSLDEAPDLGPRLLRGLGEFVGLAVEEAVGRLRVGDDPVVDAGILQGMLEIAHRGGRDALVGASEDAQDRALHLGGEL